MTMNAKSELKLLREFLKIIADPPASERKFMRLTKTAMLISFLLVLFCLSDNLDPVQQHYLLVLCAFTASTFFGLSLWFLQGGLQTAVMVTHVSEESIRQRVGDLNPPAVS